MSESLLEKRHKALDTDPELAAARKQYQGKVSGYPGKQRVPETEAWPDFAKAINEAVDRICEKASFE